jgi:hypothetical protein
VTFLSESAVAEARPVEPEPDAPEIRPRPRRPPWSRSAATLAVSIASGFGVGLIVVSALYVDRPDVEVLALVHLRRVVMPAPRVDRVEPVPPPVQRREPLRPRRVESPRSKRTPSPHSRSELPPEAGELPMLDLRCRPECLSVTDNGKSLGAPPFVCLRLAAGDHHLVARRGSVTRAMDLHLESGALLIQAVDMIDR